ncbi:tetratricopeptide repeat protein [Paraburkholderia bengalensis]|uniref:protein O-GlcNAc transferase n=1 Tax=Paraburkholderia bengalensis TaxID=2747562 RepID=A0ABU8J5I4_9BURK
MSATGDPEQHASSDVASAPADFASLLQAAFVHHQSGRASEAAALYKRILQHDGHHADAMHFLGVLACDVGDLPAGIDLIEKSLQLYPNAIYYNNLGNMRARGRDLRGAIDAYQHAIALAPDYAEAYSNLGYVQREAGDPMSAIDSCDTAVQLKPSYAEGWVNLGNAFFDLGTDDAALRHYMKALELNPNHAQAHNNVGNILVKYGRPADAEPCYRRALMLQPNVAFLHNNLGSVLRDQGRLDEAIASYRQAVSLDPGYAEANSNLLLLLNTHPRVSQTEQLEEARAFGAHQAAKAGPYEHVRPTAGAARRLRVGFVSGDLHSHPVGFFLESVLRHLDPARLELVAYVSRLREDSLTQRLKSCFTAWYDVSRLDDDACARRIHVDGIDILVDLSGHTNHNRLAVFARKPAPIQATWLGYFATTGIAAIDYVIADRHVLPADEAAHFVETPWRLPHAYLCFTPPDEAIEAGPLPALERGAITFGCFNHLVKLNDAVIALWSRVLHAVPNARLLLKTKQLDDPSVRTATLERFGAHGVAREQLMLEGQSPRAELLASYNRIDIALDPFPYTGGTTSVEALWMGVPVLTRRGDRFLSHVGESILNTVGLSEWIARDDEDYVAKAVYFSASMAQLAGLRATLRDRLAASPLCDAPLFARHLEDAFQNMWALHAAASHDHARDRRSGIADSTSLEDAPDRTGRNFA